MMKMRIRNPDVGIASARVSQYDTSRLRYIKYHSARKGAMLFTICHRLRCSSGFWYLATNSCQATDGTALFWAEGKGIVNLLWTGGGRSRRVRKVPGSGAGRARWRLLYPRLPAI